jgi:hypothetical protein
MPDLKNSDWINRIIRIKGLLAQLKEMEKADNENKWQKLNKELDELFEDISEDLRKAMDVLKIFQLPLCKIDLPHAYSGGTSFMISLKIWLNRFLNDGISSSSIFFSEITSNLRLSMSACRSRKRLSAAGQISSTS